MKIHSTIQGQNEKEHCQPRLEQEGTHTLFSQCHELAQPSERGRADGSILGRMKGKPKVTCIPVPHTIVKVYVAKILQREGINHPGNIIVTMVR